MTITVKQMQSMGLYSKKFKELGKQIIEGPNGELSEEVKK